MRSKGIYLMLIAVLGIMALGLVMLSSTAAYAPDSHGDATVFLRKQATWLGIGLIACVVTSLLDYRFWRKTWPIWLGLSIVLLTLCFVPPIGMKLNGSHRWIRLGPMVFQPSELAKVGAITFLASWFAKYETQAGQFLKGFVYPLGVISVMLVLIVKETDLGSTMLIAMTSFAIMFVGGTNPKILIPLTVLGIVAVLVAAGHMEERQGRLLAFMDLEKYKETDGLQQWAGLTALGSGGVDGLGLGNGRQKLLYLPYAHTDFILPVIGEELGLRATLAIVFAYVVIIITGIFISICAADRFGMLLGFGFVMVLAFQALVNIGVTTAMLPNKGLPLPFVSYGGSNLGFCLLAIGVLISIHRHAVEKEVVAPAMMPQQMLAARTRKARTIRI